MSSEYLPPSSTISWPTRLPFFYGWVILPTAALAIFVSGPGQTFVISVFVDPLIHEFGWSRTSVSGLYTAGSLTAAGAMFGVGWLLDRFGARVMLAGIGLVFGLAALWMSTVDSQLQLYVGFAGLRLLGQGSLTLVPTALIAVWFVRRRGRATALAGLGMMAAQVTFPPLSHLLISNYGWRDTWVILAVIIWALLIPSAVLLVRRNPESVGLRPDGEAVLITDHSAPHISASGWTLRDAMRTNAFWLLLLASSSQSLISTALTFHQADVLGARSMGPGISAIVLSVMGPAAFAGMLISGILSDRFPGRYLLVFSQIMLMLSMLLVMYLSAAWQAFAYGAIIGFSMGFGMTVSAVIWPNYYGTRHLGRIRGIATSMMVASAALGPFALSVGFNICGSYSTVLAIALLLPAACAAMAYAARPPRTVSATAGP